MHGLENGFALEQINGQRDIVLHKKLLALAEKFRAVRSRRAYRTGRGYTPRLESRLRARGEVEKNILADNGDVAFEDALLVRMPEQGFGSFVGCLDCAAGVASPGHKANPPAVGFGPGERRIFIALPADRVIRVFPCMPDVLVGPSAITWQHQIFRQRLVAVIRDRQFDELKLQTADGWSLP